MYRRALSLSISAFLLSNISLCLSITLDNKISLNQAFAESRMSTLAKLPSSTSRQTKSQSSNSYAFSTQTASTDPKQDFDEFAIDVFQEQDDVAYKLILHPLASKTIKSSDIRSCKQLEILGRYSGWHSWLSYPENVTEKGHIDALNHIKNAKAKNARIRLGAAGSGFAPLSPDNKCIVTSRALSLTESSNGFISIVSYSD